ncbi:hypothetical protein HYC85_017351 [Camellia sinensis]|uniref:C-JID domain-containing protein n=1 Tax=Camellia sinensis TaxID=4442 RepID=A0A7J7H2D1_CAMSI|nr:hypothetical protein HYC85_017351 [Camellia sinensis]
MTRVKPKGRKWNSKETIGSYGRRRKCLNIIFLGSEIPKWFNHQNDLGIGSLVSFLLPPNWYNNRFLGFAFCAAIGLMEDTLLKIGVQVSIRKHLTRYLPYITCVMKSETVWVGYISRHFLDLDQLEMDELNEGGTEFVASFVKKYDIDITDGCMGYKYDVKSNLMHARVTKCGVRLVYYKEYDNEEAVSNTIYRYDINNINLGVFDGDSDRSSVGAGEEDATATATATSKRRRDDLSDCEPTKIEPTESSSFKVHHNSKRFKANG